MYIDPTPKIASRVERKTLLSPGTGSVNLPVCVRVYGRTTCTTFNTTTSPQTLWVSQINIGTIAQLRKYELHSLLSCENVLRVTATDPPRDLRGNGIYGVAVDTVGEMICNIPVDVPFACEVFPIVQLIIFRGEGINER